MQDPFNERPRKTWRRRMQLLGGLFEFVSDSRELIELVDAAYRGLPRHGFSSRTPRLRVCLTLTDGPRPPWRVPPVLRTQAGAGLLVGVMDVGNYAAVCPGAGCALIAISTALLRFPYHARYELLEFAVFTLASRALNLAPLHAGCVGLNGRGLLLIGDSGAGKSTLAWQCAREGLEFLAEDAVFVDPRSLTATGIGNFLHLRHGSLKFARNAAEIARLRDSPRIRRRSGVAKIEIDLRRGFAVLAPQPLEIAAVICLTEKSARGRALLEPMDARACLRKLAAAQPYGNKVPGWSELVRGLRGIATFELRRPTHPALAAQALRHLLDWGAAHRSRPVRQRGSRGSQAR